MSKKVICVLMLFVFVINLVVVYGVLPDFALVESNSQNIEGKKYKTAESSLATATTPTFSFESSAQLLMEATTGKIIYANNENEKLLPASVTKIMTLLLTMEEIDSGRLKYDDILTCSEEASKMGGSQIWFKEGETLTIDEAIKCICVVSANDVCYAIGELIGGSNENFVKMMNDKAKALGMENTNFMNVHGIDEEGHYTSAKDIAIMSRELILKHPDIFKYTTIWMDSIRGGSFELANTNKLLKTYQGMNGLKTGSTSQAGFNLAASATRDNLTLIAVVLKAPSSNIRNSEITKLLNYGFSNYTSIKLGSKGEVKSNIKINKNISENAEVVLKEDVFQITNKKEESEYKELIEYNNEIVAPIKANTSIGIVKYVDRDNNIIAESELIVTKDINKSGYWEYLTNLTSRFVIKEFKNM